MLESRPSVGRLIREAGLEDAKLEAAPESTRRYLWKGDRLVPLPSGPVSFLTTPLFPLGAKLRLLREPWIRRPADGREESIAEFVRRRLGRAFLDYAVAPFVSGVYAGDPERLSVRWAVPRIEALEREHGSLIRGAVARRKGPQPGGGMISFAGGLETLPRTLASALAAAGNPVRTATPCRAIERRGDTFAAATGAESVAARRVVVTAPAAAAAELLAGVSGGRSRAFAEVPYAPVVVASYGFRRDQVRHPLDGFGFLAPRTESLRLLGCLFPSSLFPARAPAGHVAIAAFAGGRSDPGMVELDDEALDRRLLGDLDRALGLTGEPVFRHLRRWPRAIPQYEVGHGRFVDLAAEIERDLPGLHVGSSFLGGVSVPDCIERATGLAERMLGGA